MVKGALLFAGTIGKPGKESDTETTASVGVDSIEEGPGTGRECNTESIDIDKRESVARRCHTIVDIKIYRHCIDRKPIAIKPIGYCSTSP
jgi:hypothetical protein